jgi:hypothetical protein
MGERLVNTYLFILDAGLGILMIVLAIPMILQKVKPNPWYGFRTRKTLSDERVWYAANRYAGKALLSAGIVTTLAAVALYLIAGSAEQGTGWVVLWLLVLGVPLMAGVAASLAYLRTL